LFYHRSISFDFVPRTSFKNGARHTARKGYVTAHLKYYCEICGP